MDTLDTIVSGLHDDMFWRAFNVSHSNRWLLIGLEVRHHTC